METTTASRTLDVGRTLREARDRRGESLHQVAAATRISAEYLEALERDAPLSAFPAPVYAKFFLRQYARHLDLDEGSLVAAFSSRHVADPTGTSMAPLPAESRFRGLVPLPSFRRDRGEEERAARGAGTRGGFGGPSRSRSKVFSGPRRRTGPGVAASRRGVALVIAVVVLAVGAGAFLVVRSRLGSPDAEPTPSVGVTTPGPGQLPMGGTTIFPDYRVVAYYGAPFAPDLGILGLGPAEAAGRLEAQVAQYSFSARPVIPAFEVIGTLATRAPGDDGMYRVALDEDEIRQYLAAARGIGGLFVVDIQPGRADFMDEVRRYERILMEPDVGLALDPEWHVADGQVPGQSIGSVDASVINDVVDWLAELVRRHHLPQKLLVIHQFTRDMIRNKDQVRSAPGVAVTFDIDGFGDRENKISKYEAFTVPFADRFNHGFKLFYRQDVNLMTPLDVLGLRPTPDFVVYQ